MASKGSGRARRNRRAGGSMRRMRSGFQKVTGRRGKRRSGPPSFWTVLAWVFGVALLMVFIWQMNR